VKPTERRRVRNFVPTVKPLRGSIGPKFRTRSADLPCAGGSGAPARGLIAIPLMTLCVLFGLLALSAAVAQAEAPKLVSYGKFQTGENTFGVATDQAGNVYVTSLFGSKINKYEPSGKPISPPSPFGGGSERYSGVAVSPTSGDVYVVDALGQEIDTYDPSSGALLSSFAVPGCNNAAFGNYTWTQIATDSAGNVYLACAPKNEVEVFNLTGGAPSGVAATIAGSGANALSKPTGVAVDSAGNVWVADDGNSRIEEFSPSGALTTEIKSEQGLQALAVDPHGDVLTLVDNSTDFCGSSAPPCTHLVEYSPGGAKVADIGAASIGTSPLISFFGGIAMLAINESNGRVYVADGADNLVWIYGPPTAPSIGTELTAEVGASEAKLGALANPGGIPTAYRFEYGTTTAYGQSTPFPEGSVGEGVASHTVWASASGLAAGTTYHYRVTVTNELGTVSGPDQTFTTATAAQLACPNEQLRGGFSASLPDCRAYELVTPSTAITSQPDPPRAGAVYEDTPSGLAARDGNRMAYSSQDILPGSDSGGQDYVATRGVSGWSSENVTPRQSYTGDRCTTDNTAVTAYSTNLTTAALFVGGQQTAFSQNGGSCGVEGVEVVSGEPLGVVNLLLRNDINASYQLLNVPRPGVTPENAQFDGASSDLNHVVFDEQAPLTPNAPDGVDNLYEWAEGDLRLVTVLPDGAPVVGSLAANWYHNPYVISADGSHIFFTAGGKLYVRVNGQSTMQIDDSKAGGSGGSGQFQEASADGSVVFFTAAAAAGLTSDTVPGSGTNLYRYDLPNGDLTDLTPRGAGELKVSSISQDGSYLYFVARGALASGATAGQQNLYLWHEGTTTLVATLSNNDFCRRQCLLVASTNGRFFAFSTSVSLTGYDTIDANTGSPDSEVYLYDAASNKMTCASCDPSGEPPTAGGASLENQGTGPQATSSVHPLSNSGRLFFETAEALVPRDTNGQRDVYEYEGGQLYLISSGTSSRQSALIAASENGNDVFILSRQQLVPQDSHEELRVIYDARVDGGFPTPLAPPPCGTADACRTAVAPQPSIYGAPSSQTFSGAGNLAPPAEAKPKRKKATTKACKRSKRRRARCTNTVRKARAKAKSHKGGK
jgi:hypothetical protein